MTLKNFLRQKGFAALLFAILILAVIFAIGLSAAILTFGQQIISGNITKSTQAYFSAEAGIEDALVRLSKGKPWSSPYTLTTGNVSTNVVISDIIGGSRAITSQGSFVNRIRKAQVVYQISTQDVAFHYGVQVGDLGLQMGSSAKVHGNVFSNGPIVGSSSAKIYGDVISSGPSGRIEDMEIDSAEGGGNAWATTIVGGNDCEVDGDAHYVTSIDCDTVGGGTLQEADPVGHQDMPITQEQITEWKNEAAAGGEIAGYSLGSSNKDSLGPVKVNGNMSVGSSAELTMTGTIWVTGDLSLTSSAAVELASGYGSFSGVIVVNGKINVGSSVVFCGSEGYKGGGKCNTSVGSYIMLLSTKNAPNPSDPAIEATSSTKTAILYASDGFIKLSSSSKLKEATGYGISMTSSAEVTYETGLADVRFSSGPGGSWEVTSWKEVE